MDKCKLTILFLLTLFGFSACKVFAETFYCPPEGSFNSGYFNKLYVFDTEFDLCRSDGYVSNMLPYMGDGVGKLDLCDYNLSLLKKRYHSGKCKKIVIKNIDEPNCKGSVYGVQGTSIVVERYVTFGGEACVKKLKKLYPKPSD